MLTEQGQYVGKLIKLSLSFMIKKAQFQYKEKNKQTNKRTN